MAKPADQEETAISSLLPISRSGNIWEAQAWSEGGSWGGEKPLARVFVVVSVGRKERLRIGFFE